jgi:hypothetical protein
VTRTFVNGKVHVRRTQCPTCVFRPGNLMDLKEGRVKQMIDEAVRNDSCIPCHSHLHQGQRIEPVCRGFYDRHATLPIRLAQVMGLIEWVDEHRD